MAGGEASVVETDDGISLFSKSNFDDSMSYLSLDTGMGGHETPMVNGTIVSGMDVNWLRGQCFSGTVRARTARSSSATPGLLSSAPPTSSSLKKKASYPAVRKSIFYDEFCNPNLKCASSMTEVWREPAWDDVKHWNRENCGWTMSRERRFKVGAQLNGAFDRAIITQVLTLLLVIVLQPKLSNPKHRDIYHTSASEKSKAAPSFSPAYYEPPAKPSVVQAAPPRTSHARMAVGGITRTKPRSHKVDRNLGPGEYTYIDDWELRKVCGEVVHSSMFKSSSRRDLFDNDGFSKNR